MVCEIHLPFMKLFIFKSNINTAAVITVALAAMLALVACGKKVGDTGTMPAPMTLASGMK